MTEQKQVYKCGVCGNIVEVLHEAGGELVCCGKPMTLMSEQTSSEEQGKQEKHVPVIEGMKVKVGSVEHPMTKEHYIEWIEVMEKNNGCVRIFLRPEEKPEIEVNFEIEKARAYCNMHGLWTSK